MVAQVDAGWPDEKDKEGRNNQQEVVPPVSAVEQNQAKREEEAPKGYI